MQLTALPPCQQTHRMELEISSPCHPRRECLSAGRNLTRRSVELFMRLPDRAWRSTKTPNPARGFMIPTVFAIPLAIHPRKSSRDTSACEDDDVKLLQHHHPVSQRTEQPTNQPTGIRSTNPSHSALLAKLSVTPPESSEGGCSIQRPLQTCPHFQRLPWNFCLNSSIPPFP